MKLQPQPLGQPLGAGKAGVRAQPARRALGDLTNALKGAAPAPAQAKPPVLKEAAEPVEPVEQSAGKGWRSTAAEMEEQAGAAAQQQMRRLARGASTWTTSHLEIYQDDSSDGEDAGLQGRYAESEIVVQLPGAPGVDGPVPMAALRSQGSAHTLLPELPFELSGALLPEEGDDWNF